MRKWMRVFIILLSMMLIIVACGTPTKTQLESNASQEPNKDIVLPDYTDPEMQKDDKAVSADEPESSIDTELESPEGDEQSESGSQDTDVVESQPLLVEIINFDYEPKELTLSAGTEVSFVNKDVIKHTATIEGGIDSGLLALDEMFTFTFDDVGIYDLFCRPHPNMKMKIIVN